MDKYNGRASSMDGHTETEIAVCDLLDRLGNADLILKCIEMKDKHSSVMVKIIPFHKYQELPETHTMAHEAMINLRNKR